MAQTDNSVTDSTVVITMNDGVVRIGVVINDDGREILFMDNKIGKIFLTKEKIQSMVPYSQSDESLGQGSDEFTGPEGPFTTRYYFTTNALPIKKGENYAMIHLYGPEVHFAVSERLSIGVMTTWIASPFVVVGKYSIPTKNEKINLGIGTMMGSSGYLNTFKGWGGMHWGMLTIGDRLKNFTISAGYSYAKTGPMPSNSYVTPGTYPAKITSSGEAYYDWNIPRTERANVLIGAAVIGIAGIVRVGKKASFIFDSMFFIPTGEKKGSTSVNNSSPYNPITNTSAPMNTVVTETNSIRNPLGFLMPGMRFQKKPSRAFQVALAGVLASDKNELIAFPIPMVSWFFKF